MTEDKETLTIDEAATKLGKTKRSIQRYIKEGLLSKLPNGELDPDEVEALSDSVPNDSGHAISELRKTLAATQAHVNGSIKLLLESQAQTLAALAAENTRLAGQNATYQEEHVKLLNEFGEILLRKDERTAVLAGEEHKMTMRTHAFGLFAQFVPELMSQIRDGSKIKRALSTLSEDEMGMLKGGLEMLGERGKPLLEMIRKAVPEPAQNEVKSEVKSEQAEGGN